MISIVVNSFCPNSHFKPINVKTVKNIMNQMSINKTTILLYLIGYSYDIDIYSDLIDQYNDLKINNYITSDYSKIISKCHLLNKIIQILSNTEILFLYCEYDIIIDNLHDKLNKWLNLVKYKHIREYGMYSLNHNCHQLTIYENIIKIDDHLTLARPINNYGNSIGTGCFILWVNLSSLKIKEIKCDSYGYGNDDSHIYNWLDLNHLFQYVIIEYYVDHNSIDIIEYTKWKQCIIKNNMILSKNEYDKFWNQLNNKLNKYTHKFQ